MMQAVIMDRFGAPDVLHLAERPKPIPQSGEVLVKTRCVGVNYIDALTRAGNGVPVGRLPCDRGMGLGGHCGRGWRGVTRFRAGDAVFGMPCFPRLAGAYAEYVSAPAHELALKPPDVDDKTAASAPMIGLCAWRALFTLGKIAVRLATGALQIAVSRTLLAEASAAHAVVEKAHGRSRIVLDVTGRSS